MDTPVIILYTLSVKFENFKAAADIFTSWGTLMWSGFLRRLLMNKQMNS